MKNDSRSLERQLNNALVANKSLWATVDILQEALKKADEKIPDGLRPVVFSEAVREAMEFRSVVDASNLRTYRITHRVLKGGDLVGIVLRTSDMHSPLEFGVPLRIGYAEPDYEVIEEGAAKTTPEQALDAVQSLLAEFPQIEVEID